MPQQPPSTRRYNPALSGLSDSVTSRQYPNGNPDAPLNPPGIHNTDCCLPLHRAEPVRHNYQTQGPAPGALPFRWLYGSNVAALNRDPRIQVVSYNEDTIILRENVCVHWEAPFTYLLFGNSGALLIDTGATAEARYYPLRTTVDAIIGRWATLRGKRSVPLTVAFTSAEDVAQNQGVEQFRGRPHTTVVPPGLPALQRFYQMEANWPAAASARIDLGDRVIDVIPTPGAHKDGLTFYDPYSGFLYTGDLFYPGKINISNDGDYAASLARLQAWKNKHAVKWIMGGHIEMQFVPGKAYPRFATYKPYERVLQMEPPLLDEAVLAAQDIRGKQTVLIHADFILLNGVSPDQKAAVFPPGIPNIAAPRPF